MPVLPFPDFQGNGSKRTERTTTGERREQIMENFEPQERQKSSAFLLVMVELSSLNGNAGLAAHNH